MLLMEHHHPSQEADMKIRTMRRIRRLTRSHHF